MIAIVFCSAKIVLVTGILFQFNLLQQNACVNYDEV